VKIEAYSKMGRKEIHQNSDALLLDKNDLLE